MLNFVFMKVKELLLNALDVALILLPHQSMDDVAAGVIHYQVMQEGNGSVKTEGRTSAEEALKRSREEESKESTQAAQ